MVSFKSQEEFPLLDEYRKVFAITERTIFAYDNTIYANGELSDDLLVHEKTHFKQQEQYGLENWVRQYLHDMPFRLRMEVEAYREQCRSIKDRNRRAFVRMESARTLSSALYGNMVSRTEALKLIS